MPNKPEEVSGSKRIKSYSTVFKKAPDAVTNLQTQIQNERSSILEFEQLERECMGDESKGSVTASVASQRIETLEAKLQDLVSQQEKELLRLRDENTRAKAL